MLTRQIIGRIVQVLLFLVISLGALGQGNGNGNGNGGGNGQGNGNGNGGTTFIANYYNTIFNPISTIQLETGATNQSAFSLVVESKGKEYSLYATISAFSPGVSPFGSTIPFAMSLRSITGVATTGQVTGIIPLSNYPSYAILATNATKTTSGTATWTYDLIFSPVAYTLPPGTYTFTLTVRYNDGKDINEFSFPVILTIPAILELQRVQNTTPSFNFLTIGELQDGKTIPNLNTFQVKSNVLWKCLVKASPSTFTNTGTFSSPNVSASKLSVLTTTPSSTITITGVDQSMKTGNRGNASVSGNTFNIDLKTTPGFTMGVGSYLISLVYTLTPQ